MGSPVVLVMMFVVAVAMAVLMMVLLFLCGILRISIFLIHVIEHPRLHAEAVITSQVRGVQVACFREPFRQGVCPADLNHVLIGIFRAWLRQSLAGKLAAFLSLSFRIECSLLGAVHQQRTHSLRWD
jgi:hypothetical protein